MLIKRAKTQGFCFGVAITVKKAEEAVAQPGSSVTTLGHVVHNPQMVASLEEQAANVIGRLAGVFSKRALSPAPATLGSIAASFGPHSNQVNPDPQNRFLSK